MQLYSVCYHHTKESSVQQGAYHSESWLANTNERAKIADLLGSVRYSIVPMTFL
jgi:hypothetical protein